MPWDFSTCANAAGPCPMALDALRDADPSRYPDPHSHALRERLGELHDVAPQRIVIAASASEFIQRLTAVGARLEPGAVHVQRHAYGDYAVAAAAWGRTIVSDDDATTKPTLRWCADPSSPLGEASPSPADAAAVPTVLDAVYAPLRLHGRSAWTRTHCDEVFVLHSPNKALGLTGVRGAYAVAPSAASWNVDEWLQALEAAQPSWPLGAHGVALLNAWCEAAVQQWVQQSHATLADWKQQLMEMLAGRGFTSRESDTSFFCTRAPQPIAPFRLRRHGVAVRDATSFGLPGWWRVSAQPPQAIERLATALDAKRARS